MGVGECMNEESGLSGVSEMEVFCGKIGDYGEIPTAEVPVVENGLGTLMTNPHVEAIMGPQVQASVSYVGVLRK